LSDPPFRQSKDRRGTRRVPPVAAAETSLYGCPDIKVLGFRVHPMSGDEVVQQIALAVGERRRLIMANLNLHAMAMMFESATMAGLFTQPDTQVMIDGMPVLWAANLSGHRLPRTKRTTSLEFYDAMFRRGVAEGWRFGYLGARSQALEEGLAVLRRRYPGIDLDGRDGYFDLDAEAGIISWLQERSHDVLIVGMGMPRQEEWIARTQGLVDTRVFLPTGGYLDYQVGAQKLAPRWMGQFGVEWAYRLANSPRRLSKRYLVEPFVLALRLVTRQHPQEETDAL
jgi:N-acetylglucosaminyldiphosphoundecaprenol N-acetyl-beta-D-mannosaminyltransferase